ncbi:hypothetical protein ACLK1T_02610 [Escherichia coli]
MDNALELGTNRADAVLHDTPKHSLLLKPPLTVSSKRYVTLWKRSNTVLCCRKVATSCVTKSTAR